LPVSEQFRRLALAKGAKERKIHAFLKEYPFALIRLVNLSWNFYCLVSEFRLGNDFRADFLVLSADSGQWHAHFIELEGPQDNPYRKDRTPSPKLNWAFKQTDDWREFTDQQKPALQREFAKHLRPFKAAAQNALMGKGTTADIEIEHPSVYLGFDYHLVIGNSSTFTEEERATHKRYSSWRMVMSYDRIYESMVEIESWHDDLASQKRILSTRGRKLRK
jgi:hypothetical protein